MRNGVVPQVIRPEQAGNAGNGEHPYLRSVQHRGGGYAILRALWDAEKSPSYAGHLDATYGTTVAYYIKTQKLVPFSYLLHLTSK